jgi:DNA end-binding protein Ku
MAARTLWNGTLELGDIAIPVGLASTIRDGRIEFRQLHNVCMTPTKSRPYCERHEQLLDPDDLVRAWEIAAGEYLEIPPDARELLEPVETRRVPIGLFTPAATIEPRLVRKRYHLIPSTAIGTRAYFLLVCAIAELDVAGVVRFTWKGEKLGALTSRDGLLELAVLHFADELVDDTDILRLTDGIAAIDNELLELARELVNRHTRPLRPDDLTSIDRPRVRQMLEQLLAGQPIIRPTVQEDERPEPTANLEGALRSSIKQAPRRKKPRAPAAAR